jgi:hypothetical protein
VARRASTGLERAVGPGRRIRIDDPVVAKATEHLGSHALHVVPDGDRVIAGVEDEHRDRTISGEEVDQAPHLVDRGCGGIHGRTDAHHIDRCGPAVWCPVGLTDPLKGPTRNDGLPGRVLGGRVVEAPLGTAFGVAPVPGRGIDGEDQGPGTRTVLDQESTQPSFVDAPAFQRLVEAAVTAAILRLEAE